MKKNINKCKNKICRFFYVCLSLYADIEKMKTIMTAMCVIRSYASTNVPKNWILNSVKWIMTTSKMDLSNVIMCNKF